MINKDCKVSDRHRFLSSCIKVEEKRISRQGSIPNQVYFELNLDLVDRIREIKAEYGSLYLKPEQLTNLRYYSLINSPLANNSVIDSDRLSLVFSSNYSLTNSQIQTTVIRSKIHLTGQISQEVRRDLWQDSALLFQVIQAHHWLTAEILRQLPLESRNQTLLIFWVLWIVSAVLFGGAIWYFVLLSFTLKLVANIVSILLLKMLIKYIINYRLKQFILNQLFDGYLSNKTNKRQLGFKLLSLLN